jgi:outer membrane protein insertion porin family
MRCNDKEYKVKTGRQLRILLTAVLVAAGARAGLILDEIRIERPDQTALDASFVRAYTSLRAGQQLETEQDLNIAVARDVDSLRESGRFSFVRAFVEQQDGKRTLVYSVTPRRRLQAVEVAGAEHIKPARIKKELELKTGDYIDEALVGEKVRKVEEYCRKNKFPNASVSFAVTPGEGDAASLLITVDEGEKLRVKEIAFEGNRFLSDSRKAKTVRFFKRIVPGKEDPTEQAGQFETARLRKLLNQKTIFMGTPWGGSYRPELADADAAVIRNFYMDQGFQDVSVQTPVVENIGDGKLRLTYRVDEGGLYRIGQIAIEGADVFESSELEKQLRLNPGDIASQDAIKNAAAAVRRYYGNRGYIHTLVEPVVRKDPAALIVDLVLNVREGALAHIHEINIRGNEKTRDEVMRRELAVAPGELFHEQKVETSEARLRNLGYFKKVDSSYTPAEGTNSYDLSFNVEEKAMGSFMVGAGFSSEDSLVGFAEVSHGNFDIRHWPPVGDGQKAKVRVQAGSERNDVEVSFVEPWFLDKKLSLGVDLYHREASYYSDYYSLDTTGGSLSLSKPLGPFLRGTFKYSLENYDVYDLSDDVPSEIEADEGSSTKSTAGVTVSRDTRDQFFNPTRGNRTSGTFELAGSLLGGDTDIYFMEAKSSHFWPLWKEHVLNLRGALRMVDSYGSGDVLVYDRLFLGGPRSLRGFEYNDVSPRSADDDSDAPIGGLTSYFATLEYTVPLWEKIRGAVFYDIGAVNSGSFDFGMGDLNSDYGIGARFDLPMFPLRLDYAFPHLTDDENDASGGRWNFLLGYTF